MTDLIKLVGTALRAIVFRASLCAQHTSRTRLWHLPQSSLVVQLRPFLSRDVPERRGQSSPRVGALGTKGLTQPKAAEGLTHIGMQERMGAGKRSPGAACCTAGIAGLALGAQQAGTLQSQGYHVMLVVAMETVVSHGKHASIVPVPPRAERSQRCQGAGTQVTGCPVLGAKAVLQSAVLLSPHVQCLGTTSVSG